MRHKLGEAPRSRLSKQAKRTAAGWYPGEVAEGARAIMLTKHGIESGETSGEEIHKHSL